MTDLVLVLSAPGGVDAKGNLKNSFPVSTLAGAGPAPGYVSGINIKNASATTIEVGTGTMTLIDGTSFYSAQVQTPIAVNIDAKGAGGIDTGNKTTQAWYYVWLIANNTTNAKSAVFSLSASAPVLPAGYTLSRRVGSVYVNPNGTIKIFRQIGGGADKQYYASSPGILGNGTQQVPTRVSTTTDGSASPLATSIGLSAFYRSPSDLVLPFYYISIDAQETIQTIGNGVVADAGKYDYLTVPVINGEIYYSVAAGNLGLTVRSWTETI